MTEAKRPLKVFLCHAHSDKDAVKALYSRLTKDGVDAWLDKEKLLPGQDWELEIRKAVREADVVVVCLSKQFNQAGFRQKEVRLALDTAMEQPEGEIFIVPARLEECDTLESLRKWHWVDLFEEDGYELFIHALQTRADKIGASLREKQIWLPRKMPHLGLEKNKLKNVQSKKLIYKSNKATFIVLLGIAGIVSIGLIIKGWFSPLVSVPQIIPSCIAPTGEANPYLSFSNSDILKIYTDYREGLISLETVKQNALSGLGKSTENWSAFVDVAIDDKKMIRIMVTYLDPLLIQYIALNHELSSLDNVTNQTAFDTQLSTMMNKLGMRNERLFVVTITSPVNSNALYVRLPIGYMTLISTSGVRISPTHVDPILNENNNIARGPVSGIIGYPIAIIYQNQCLKVVDEQTRMLTLDIPTFSLGDVQFDSQFWNIPLQHNAITELNPYGPLLSPPTPSWIFTQQVDVTDNIDWGKYWEGMGRYLWNIVITASNH
jgi:hypothetical protein